MPNPFLGVRIPPELHEAIAARMRETGQSRSDVVIAALKQYLGMSSCQERLAAVEKRLSVLEDRLGVTKHHATPILPPNHSPTSE